MENKNTLHGLYIATYNNVGLVRILTQQCLLAYH